MAMHQPTTRAEIEEIRGVVGIARDLDQLIELDWDRFGRRKMNARPAGDLCL